VSDFAVLQEPLAAKAKIALDRVLDACGPPPRGAGLQNLRECIAETKWKYDVAPEERQGAWKNKIVGKLSALCLFLRQ